jgi:hypothetical protein
MSARKSLWVSIGRHGNDWSLFTNLNGNYWNLFTGLMRALSEAGLISHGSDLQESFERAAFFVDRIRGDPGDLPFEQPTHYSPRTRSRGAAGDRLP